MYRIDEIIPRYLRMIDDPSLSLIENNNIIYYIIQRVLFNVRQLILKKYQLFPTFSLGKFLIYSLKYD